MFYRPTSFWTWTLLVATVIETGAVLTNEAVMLSKLITSLSIGVSLSDLSVTAKIIPTFLALLIFGFIYQSLLLYDTLAQRNTIQLGGLCVYAACLFIYTTIQINQIEKAIENLGGQGYFSPGTTVWASLSPLAVANTVITGIYTVAISFIGYKLYTEFQWTIYRQLNANLYMQRRYFAFKIYTTLLKFDFFFFTGYLLQYITISTGRTAPITVQLCLTYAAIPISIITLVASTWFMRRENKLGITIILCLHLALLAFFLFLYVNLYQLSQEQLYLPVRQILSYFGTITILHSVSTIVVAVKCIGNFDKGLKIHITSRRLARELLEDHETEMEILNHGMGQPAGPE